LGSPKLSSSPSSPLTALHSLSSEAADGALPGAFHDCADEAMSVTGAAFVAAVD
jgi:hypothetical protein